MISLESTDLQLINLVKQDQNSDALNILIDKVTGLYVSTVTGYTYVPYFERQELLDHKHANIYSFIEDYNPNRGMAFSTYIAQRTKWKCKSLINKYPEAEELNKDITEDKSCENIKSIENEDIYQYILTLAADIDDSRFYEIFRYRHCIPVKKNWKEIGKIFGITNEGARKIYNRNFLKLKNKINKEENETKL